MCVVYCATVNYRQQCLIERSFNCTEILYLIVEFNWPLSSVAEDIAIGAVREVWSLNPGYVKSDKVSPTARHRCDVSSELMLPRR